MAGQPTDAPLRLGFAGTPDFAATILSGLLEAGRAPTVVYTQPDRPTGRGRRVTASAVKLVAAGHDLPVRQPETLRGPQAAEALRAWGLDVLVVAAYGLILPPTILAVPALGCVNVHASLLPRWRGAAPVERAIMAGDTETGVSIMRMERGLDTGPVFLQRQCPIGAATEGPELETRLAHMGCEALLHCLERLPALTPSPQPDSGVTYAHKLTRADAVIDWSCPAIEVERQVRALCGRMPAFTDGDGVRKTILKATAEEASPNAAPGTVVAAGAAGIRVACGQGLLNVSRLRLSVGKGRPLSAADAVNGYPGLFAPGTPLNGPDPRHE